MSIAPYVASSTPDQRDGQAGTAVGAGCYSYPERPGQLPRPARREDVTSTGWDAGAHSILQIDGNCRLAFSVNQSAGVICGLTPANTAPSAEPARVTHGWLVSRTAGAPTAQVVESGAVRAGPFAVNFGDTLEVRRVGSTVTYLRGTTTLHTSANPLAGRVKAASSLYGSEDFIG